MVSYDQQLFCDRQFCYFCDWQRNHFSVTVKTFIIIRKYAWSYFSPFCVTGNSTIVCDSSYHYFWWQNCKFAYLWPCVWQPTWPFLTSSLWQSFWPFLMVNLQVDHSVWPYLCDREPEHGPSALPTMLCCWGQVCMARGQLVAVYITPRQGHTWPTRHTQWG